MEVIENLMTLLSIYTVPVTGLYEVHAEVQWAPNQEGYRFFHTRHDPVPPCISEAIEANILSALSEMKQRMTGHATLEAGTTVSLEVWSSVPTVADVVSFQVFELGKGYLAS